MDERFETDPFENVVPFGQRERGDAPTLIVDVDGFEGPLDLLLTLARTQKVDLTKISILRLAEQYLVFVDEARALRLDLAADYLVMAAWLAYLKSRLLLPEPETTEEEPSAEELAAQLAFRLKRLEAMRDAAGRLMGRDRLGRDVFARGMPEGVRALRRSAWEASLVDLLRAYTEQRQRSFTTNVVIRSRPTLPLKEARAILERMIGEAAQWCQLDALLAHYLDDLVSRRTVLASGFAASLELVRDGSIELRQDGAFAPLYARRRVGGDMAEPVTDRGGLQ